MKAAAVAATQQSTTKKWDKDALVLSEEGVGLTAHLAACSTMVEVAAMTTMTRRRRQRLVQHYNCGGEHQEQREIGRYSVAQPRVDNARQTQSTPMPMLMLTLTSASCNDCIGTLRRQRRGRCRRAGSGLRREQVAEGAMTAVGARRGSQ